MRGANRAAVGKRATVAATAGSCEDAQVEEG